MACTWLERYIAKLVYSIHGVVVAISENIECRDLFECLRTLGSWKAYARRPHVKMLVLRALVVRDRASTRDGTLRRLVTLPDVVLWRVLSYWRATE